MTCHRKNKVKQRLQDSIKKKSVKSLAPTPGFHIINCLFCGQSYHNEADPIAFISFCNVLRSTIFMRDRYTLDNLPHDKRSQFQRYCGRYSRLFVCSTCDSKITSVYDQVYRIYKRKKR